MRRHTLGLVVLLACAAAHGCGDQPASGTSPSAASTPSAAASSSQPPPDPVAPPNALDMEGLRKSLKCGNKTADGPCPILEKFSACKEGWSPITQSGDGRWIGKGHQVNKGKFLDEITLVRTKRVGVADVAPGQLGVKVSITALPEDRGMERSAAEMAIRALERGDVTKPDNRAIAYVVERTDWPDAFAQQADKHQVYVAIGAGAYLCADTATQRLYLVRLAATQEHPADGLYATLYPVKW